nr:MAG TPA: hypothetical protein [Caudoviricetes sp.]
MVDFKFYLNRQGVRGQRGEKGDTGFSPIITEKTNTKEEYVLHIQNETNDTSFDTPNLKEGFIPEDMGGTYVRLNRETGNQYYGNIDEATEEVAGVVKLTKEAEVLNPTSEVSVLTAQEAKDNYATLESLNTANTSITNLQASKQNKLVAGDNVTLTNQADGTTKIDVTSYGGGDVSSAGNNKFTGDNTFTGKVNIAGGALTVDGVANLNQTTAQYLNAVNITSTGEVKAVSIKANGLCSDDIQTTENKKYLTELDVDNQTIQVVEGKLHANLDELGNEVNDLSGRVTANEADISTMKTSLSMKQTKLTAGVNVTLTDLTDGTVRIDSTGGGGTGDVPIATTTTAGKVKPDGTTITITDDGTISAVGGGSAPTNMVTIDTKQEISGQKTFTYLGSSFDGNIYPSLKINELTIGQTGATTPASAFQSSSDLAFYVDNFPKALVMGANETSDTFSLATLTNNLTIGSDGKIVLSAGTQGTLTIDGGVKFKDYYQKEYNLLNATPTVIDGGDSTSV